MAIDTDELGALIARHGAVMRVVVAAVRGSAPREVGTHMFVWGDGQTGTIGGGALEWQAVQIARDRLARAARDHAKTWPLGPDLGQCCGGAVTLVWERFDAVPDLPFARNIDGHSLIDAAPNMPEVWIWGMGHVGTALATMLAPLDFALSCVDHTDVPLPAATSRLTPIPTDQMAQLAQHAPADAHHIIATRDHDVDLALCAALLRRGATDIGLIGSATKWRRFAKRLAEAGHDDLSAITCPIGDPTLGRSPQAIALGVTIRLLKATAGGGRP